MLWCFLFVGIVCCFSILGGGLMEFDDFFGGEIYFFVDGFVRIYSNKLVLCCEIFLLFVEDMYDDYLVIELYFL